MCSIYDWKIHKRLLDAGGLGPVVYIWLPRTNRNLSLEYQRYLELQSAGRTVVYVRPGDHKNRDILTPGRYERAERIWNEFWKDKRKGE